MFPPTKVVSLCTRWRLMKVFYEGVGRLVDGPKYRNFLERHLCYQSKPAIQPGFEHGTIRLLRHEHDANLARLCSHLLLATIQGLLLQGHAQPTDPACPAHSAFRASKAQAAPGHQGNQRVLATEPVQGAERVLAAQAEVIVRQRIVRYPPIVTRLINTKKRCQERRVHSLLL